jgi:hypothetical protein
LSVGGALLGQRTPKPEGGRVVSALVGRHPVLERPCGHRNGKDQGQNKGHKPNTDSVSHGALAGVEVAIVLGE